MQQLNGDASDARGEFQRVPININCRLAAMCTLESIQISMKTYIVVQDLNLQNFACPHIFNFCYHWSPVVAYMSYVACSPCQLEIASGR